jgi:hypothetical protein
VILGLPVRFTGAGAIVHRQFCKWGHGAVGYYQSHLRVRRPTDTLVDSQEAVYTVIKQLIVRALRARTINCLSRFLGNNV